ncbi:hypothetical protein [Streptomyces sp. NPDC048516]|uniref:hypothetical protein n=1 Tax=Streptomyces sp. NPDC048516 TaxID=3365565 RepID=UPI00372004FF
MAAELMGIDIAQGGAVALLAVVVLMVLTGRLIPRRTYDDMREERNTWRDAHTESEAARAEERDQNRQLMELAHTAGHVLDSLPKRGEVQSDPMDEAPLR